MRSRTLIAISLVAAAAVSLLTAGCGGSSMTTAATTENGPLAYAHCMRTHRVPNFPDPTGESGKQAVVSALREVSNSQAQAAQTACAHVNGGSPGTSQSATSSQAQTAGAVAFSRCLRSHGFPNFPDPTSSGQLTHQMVANAGINVHQPAVLRAADACVSVTHGVITKATVASFVAGQ